MVRLASLTTSSVIVPNMYEPRVILNNKNKEARAVEDSVEMRVLGLELASTIDSVVTAQ